MDKNNIIYLYGTLNFTTTHILTRLTSPGINISFVVFQMLRNDVRESVTGESFESVSIILKRWIIIMNMSYSARYELFILQISLACELYVSYTPFVEHCTCIHIIYTTHGLELYAGFGVLTKALEKLIYTIFGTRIWRVHTHDRNWILRLFQKGGARGQRGMWCPRSRDKSSAILPRWFVPAGGRPLFLASAFDLRSSTNYSRETKRALAPKRERRERELFLDLIFARGLFYLLRCVVRFRVVWADLIRPLSLSVSPCLRNPRIFRMNIHTNVCVCVYVRVLVLIAIFFFFRFR